MTIGEFLSAIVAGLLNTATLALIGLAIVVTFRATRVLNIATGQFMVLGSYTFYWLYVTLSLPFAVAVLAALLLSALYGLLTHQLIMRRFVGQPLFVPAIVSLGLASVLGAITDMIWGSNQRQLPLPFPSRAYYMPVGGRSAYLTNYQIGGIVISIVLLVAFAAFERRSRFGLQMRAASENPLLASVSGIPINRIYLAGWALGTVIATVIGLNYAYVSGIMSQDAATLGLAALAPVVVAGFDNLRGLVIGSAIVGFIQAFVQLWTSVSAADAVTFMVLLLVVLIKPTGLFGQSAAVKSVIS